MSNKEFSKKRINNNFYTRLVSLYKSENMKLFLDYQISF